MIIFISGSGDSVLKSVLNVAQSVWQMGNDDIIYIIFFVILRIPSMLTVYIRPIEIIFTTLVVVVRVWVLLAAVPFKYLVMRTLVIQNFKLED